MLIFFSYGHDEYAAFANRLKQDLEAEGFRIWIDKERIQGTADWENAIEQGIQNSDWIVLFMTKHSVRRPDGVCLDEVSFARFLGKSIAPIMVQEVRPPLCIARIQWIDMTNFFSPDTVSLDEDAYQQQKNYLLRILQGIETLALENDQLSLREKLSPLDNDVYSEHFRRHFYGRESLVRYYDNWYRSDRKVLWLVGAAGIGKTAFIAHLCTIRPELQAIHFCRYNDNERADPKRAIMSLAFYMSTQLPPYKERLRELKDLGSLIEKSTSRLFEYLIIEPLNNIQYNGETLVIVIDALDEATSDNRNELADIIASQFEKTPSWLKLVITSRKEVLLERKLSKFHPVDFSDTSIVDNHGDIRRYLELRLNGILDDVSNAEYILDCLCDKSDGIFLYAKTVCDEILSGKLSVQDTSAFPCGLTGIYYNYFDRILQSHSAVSYKNDVRPLMEILCTSFVPVSEDFLCDILDLDEYDISDVLDIFSEMFPIKNDVIEPIHKSIVDWLTDPQKSGDYKVSAKRGHGRLADHYFTELQQGHPSPYTLKYLCRHLLGNKRIDDAIEVLSSADFCNKRIEVLGLDSAVREMLFELTLLHNIAPHHADAILGSPAFTDLFSIHRQFFYNSGLYFSLKACGFSEFLTQKTTEWDPDGEIGIAYYYYITESFDKAILKSDELLKRTDLSTRMQEELLNLLGLCYRKSVDFDLAQDYFHKAFRIGKESNELYYRSTSLINLGKIAYHLLDWEEAAEWNRQGIACLKQELAATEPSDYHITLELFLAEYHRLTAECLIWNGDIDQVNAELTIASDMYQKIQSRDRYYIRFLYTCVFRDILEGHYQEADKQCSSLLDQATSSYDKSQILFYRSLAALKRQATEDAVAYAKEAFSYATSIDARLEAEEILTVLSFCQASPHSRTDHYHTNPCIRRWVEHETRFITDILP